MGTETAFDYLTPEHRLRMIDSSSRLQYEFDGVFDATTIDRILRTSYDAFADHADNELYAPAFAERFARVRLRAMVAIDAKDAGSVPIVLFVSTHDSSRAQMATAYFRSMVGDRALTWSGGLEPDVHLNPEIVTAMSADGIDISDSLPKPWNNEIIRAADVVVTLGCADAVPVYPGRRYVDWQIPDPGTDDAQRIRAVRDDVKSRVRELVDELGLGG